MPLAVFMMFADLIWQLDRCLQCDRPAYYGYLQPGVPADSFTEFEERFGLQLPADFKALYTWRNGQPNAQFESLHDNWMFAAIADIADTKAMLDEMIDGDFDDPQWWRRGWVPFLSNGGGDWLCLDLTAAAGGQPGQLLIFWHDDGDRTVEYSSLGAWLQNLVESMAHLRKLQSHGE
jgi:cell wall assembly regulator SMI1